MSSESERRLSTEDLKRLNQPSKAAPPPMVLLPEADWTELLNHLEHLETSVGAQGTLLRALSRQVGQCPTREQTEALARDVAQIREALQQAGKKKERRFSLPKLCLPYIPWSRLFLGLAALLLTGAALWVLWSSWEKIWNIFRPIFQ